MMASPIDKDNDADFLRLRLTANTCDGRTQLLEKAQLTPSLFTVKGMAVSPLPAVESTIVYATLRLVITYMNQSSARIEQLGLSHQFNQHTHSQH